MTVVDPALSFGSLNLIGLSEDGLYELRALGSGDGTNLAAAPDAITATMQSFVQDGAIVATTGHENRTLTVAVQVLEGVNADPGAGLAVGEAALVEQCRATWDGQIVPLSWTPPVSDAPTSVWQCTAAELGAADWDDFDELDPEHRGALYLLTLTCNPWAYADTQVTETIPAPTSSDPVTPTVTVVDDCDYASASAAETAGWSVGSGDTLGVGATYVYSYQAPVSGAKAVKLSRSFDSVDMSSTPYLRLNVVIPGWPGNPLTVKYAINGTTVAPAANDGIYIWLHAPATLTSLDIIVTAAHDLDELYIYCFDVSRADMIAAGTLTQHEVYRQFEVQGSVRTPASIAVRGVTPSTQADSALGQSLVYTTRADGVAVPALRAALQSGPTETTDTTAYSGKASALSTTHTFLLDASTVASGGYDLLARVQASSTGTKSLTWTAKTLVGGTAVDDGQSGTVSVSIAAANTWQVVDLAHLALPTTQSGSGGQVQITLSSTTLTLDDAWLFDLDHGQLTVLDAGDNTRVWLDASSFASPTWRVWVGSEEDRSDAYVPSDALCSQQHEVAPSVVNVFVASANPPEVSLTYTPAGHTRAPKVAS